MLIVHRRFDRSHGQQCEVWEGAHLSVMHRHVLTSPSAANLEMLIYYNIRYGTNLILIYNRTVRHGKLIELLNSACDKPGGYLKLCIF